MSVSADDFQTSSDLLDCKTTESDLWTKALSVDFAKTTTIDHSLTLKAKIEGSTSDFYLESQEGGGFVALSTEFPGAVGQGETIEEAMADIQSAIGLLKEVFDEDKQASQNKK